MTTDHRIFISYAHEDPKAWVDEVLSTLKSGKLESWIDHKIRTGDHWKNTVLDAIEGSTVAILLVSRKFLSSHFITTRELPRMLERQRRKQLHVYPLLVEDCPFQQHAWLGEEGLQLKFAKAPLSSLAESERATALKHVITELAALPALYDRHDPVWISTELLRRSLLEEELDQASALDLAQTLTVQINDRRDELLKESRIPSQQFASLVEMTRVGIEYYLLGADELTPSQLRSSIDLITHRYPSHIDEKVRKELTLMEKGFKTRSFQLAANTKFFLRTREREPYWLRYFRVLRDIADAPIATLNELQVRGGFVAPQYLVAGLLSRFKEDWRPVLARYETSAQRGDLQLKEHGETASRPEQSARAAHDAQRPHFYSVRATQWTCWLVWGPSIPICTCQNWRGAVAYQFGLGDENNSIPVYESLDDKDRSGTIRAAHSQKTDVIRARVFDLNGRLQWAPSLLKLDPTIVKYKPEIDPEYALLHEDDVEGTELDVGAAAQRALFAASSQGDQDKTDHSDGLVFKSHGGNAYSGRRYFSAYLWVMFLVRRSRDAKRSNPMVRLGGNRFPPLIGSPSHREIRRLMKDNQLWEDLLPVFIHANIGDPSAFELQRRLLVEKSMGMLRSLWDDPKAFFEEEREAGIQFELVCSSDYSGCGCAIRHPNTTTLVSLLHERLAQDAARNPEDGLAKAVVLPSPEESYDTRPPHLRAFFSACQLPDLVGAFYEGVRPTVTNSARRARQ